MQKTIYLSPLLTMLLLSQPALAQDTAVSETVAKADPPWMQICRAGAKQHTFVLASSPRKPLKLIDHPVLIHSQSIRDDQLGALFLWVQDDGRPAVFGDGIVAPDNDRPGTHYYGQEFHAMCAEPLRGEGSSSMRNWRTRGPALKWTSLATLQSAPKDERAMVIQSRKFTRDLKAHGIDWRHDDQRRGYRLLSKPLYTYTVAGDDATEHVIGAVFAFCLSVDPEILLSIEARTKAGNTEWFQSFAAFSDMHLFVEQDGDTVWKADPPQWGNAHSGTMQVNLKLPIK